MSMLRLNNYVKKIEMINEGKEVLVRCDEWQGKARSFVEFNKMNGVEFRSINHVSKTFFSQTIEVLENASFDTILKNLEWIKKMVVIYENDYNTVKEQYDEDLEASKRVKKMSPATQQYRNEMLEAVKKFLTDCDNKKEIGAVLNGTILYLRDTLEVNGYTL